MKIEKIVNDLIKNSGAETNLISDGYHTFGELYDHRITLFITLCKALNRLSDVDCEELDAFVWRSKKHSDGEIIFDGKWFILGINNVIKPYSQITYHLPIERWEETNFATTLEKGYEWDGHTSKDVLIRLKNLLNG